MNAKGTQRSRPATSKPGSHSQRGSSRTPQDYKAGKVPAERVARLEALPGWVWDVLAARWETHYNALAAYVAREGHARVPSGHHEGEVKLGTWVIAQRQAHRKAELTTTRTERLEAQPGWIWQARDRRP